MKFVYPAIFTPFEDGDGYTVEVPDLPGCVTEGCDIHTAILMGVDAASGWILDELEDGRIVPVASAYEAIDPGDGFVNLLMVDIDDYAARNGSQDVKSVERTINVPEWLDHLATARGVDYSQALRDGLLSAIGL